MVRILAFCGGASSAENLRLQILPIVHNLEEDGTAQFRFAQGTHEVTIPRGYEDFYGPPPYYSFEADIDVKELERKGVFENSNHLGDTPEETMRNLVPPERVTVMMEGYQHDIKRFNDLLDAEGPFDAVIGFSQGASIGATLLADNIRKSQAAGVASMFKMAVFISGGPPLNLRDGGLLLADTDGEVFDLPTVHVFGSADPLISSELCLYNLCDPEKAEMFDHGQGHQSVWEKRAVHDLCQLLRKVISSFDGPDSDEAASG